MPILKKTIGRFKAEKGETLVETLAAVAVSALAVVMLSTGIATSANLNNTAHEQEGAIRASLQAAERAAADARVAEKTVVVTPPGGSPRTYAVDVYGAVGEGGSSDVVSYSLKD